MDNSKEIFSNSYPNKVHEQWIRYESDRERYTKVTEAIQSYPHTEEVVKVDSIALGIKSDVAKLDAALHIDMNRYLSGRFLGESAETVRYFSPYDRCSSDLDEYIGVEFETTAVVFNVYNEHEMDKVVAPSGYLMLFRLGFVSEEFNAQTIGIGENAQYGAIIENGLIRPIRIQTDITEERTHGELRRRDSTTGEESVDMRNVSTWRRPAKCFELSKDDATYVEVINEIDAFIAQCRVA